MSPPGGIDWPTHVALVVFDFDGVMTDNTVYVNERGEEWIRCNRADGWGVARLFEAGVSMIVLSTEANPVVAARCRKLKLPCVQARDDKGAFLRAFLREREIPPSNVVYVGNDVNDLECLELVGHPVAVADAHPAVLAVAKTVLSRPGGNGAVRELCDRLLAHMAASAGAGSLSNERRP